MNQKPDTYAQRQRERCRGKVDAGPNPRYGHKKKKTRLGFFAMPHAFIAHEWRSELQHPNYWL